MGIHVEGTVADGFEGVRDAFARNFEVEGEVGASVAAYHHGELVVDLWGGTADVEGRRPYDPDGLQLVFSSTKGVVAAAAHLLVQRGLLDLDEPVATYWPEFAQAGKGAVPVRWLLGHRAGLVGIDTPLTVDELCAWDPLIDALAAQAPLWEPGTAHGYHALTFGHLVGELIRRVSGQSVGDFVRTEVAGPLGVEFHIGVDEADLDRVVPLIPFDLGAAGAEPDPLIMAMLTPDTPTHKAFFIAPVLIDSFNQPQLLRAQIPAANGCTNARALARIYASLVSEVDGIRLLAPDTVATAVEIQSSGPDLVLVGQDTNVANGWFLPDDRAPQLGPGSFGHSGLGGSQGCALPERELAFAYTMNKCRAEVRGDPRTLALVRALRAATDR